MPNQTVTYQLQAQSSLAQTLKVDSDAMRQLASSAALTHRELVSGMNASSRAAAELRRELGQTTASHQGFAASLGSSIPVGALAAAGVLAVGAAVVGLGSALITNAATMEQSRVGFTQLTGSAAAAQAELKEIAAFAAKTPFNAADVRAYAQAFQAMGIAQADVLPDLTALGNAVSAMGKGRNELESAALAWEQVHAKGKLAGQEILQFTNAGIPVLKILSEQLGITKGAVSDLSQAGQISADVWERAFKAYSDKNWGGAMEAQSHTLNGLLSNVQDLGEQFATVLGGPVIAVAEKEIAQLVSDLSDPAVGATLTDWGDKLGRLTQAAFSAWDTFAAGARQALDAVRPITDAIGQLIGGLPAVKVDTGGSNPIAPLTTSAAALNTQIDLSATKTNDYKAEIQAAQDTLTALRRTQQDASYATDAAIQQERTKLSVLQEQWAVQDQATSITRLQAKIAKDTLLAKDIYSSAGQSAAKRLVDEQQQLADMQVKQNRDGQKRQLDDKISGLEGQKRAQDHAAQQAERAVTDEITALQRRAAFEKSEAERRQRQYETDKAAWDAAEKVKQAALTATSNEYRQMYDYTLPKGTGTLTTEFGKQSAVLVEFKKQLDDVARVLGFPDAPAALKELRFQMEDLGNFIKTHFEAVGKTLEHVLSAGGVAALKLRAALGLENTPAGTAAIQKYDREDALINSGMDQANRAYEVQRRALEKAYGKAQTPLSAVGPSTNTFTAGLQATDPVYGSTRNKLLNIAGGTDPIPPQVAPQPKGTGGGGLSGSLFGSHDLEYDENGRPIKRRAGGGPVQAGSAYLVGEQGPETFVPGSNGSILPNGTGGAMAVEVTHLCPACLERTVERVIRRKGSQLVARSVMGAMG